MRKTYTSLLVYSCFASCGYSLRRDCLRYYGCGSMVALFCYSPIDMLSVHLPPVTLEFSGYTEQEWLRKEAAELLCKAKALYAEISSALRMIEEEKFQFKSRTET